MRVGDGRVPNEWEDKFRFYKNTIKGGKKEAHTQIRGGKINGDDVAHLIITVWKYCAKQRLNNKEYSLFWHIVGQ